MQDRLIVIKSEEDSILMLDDLRSGGTCGYIIPLDVTDREQLVEKLRVEIENINSSCNRRTAQFFKEN